MSQEQARELIERITDTVSKNYGKVLPRWVGRVHAHREAIPFLINRFIQKAGIIDPYQVRIARKFGLVYAAGTIACKKKFMPWNEEFVFEVVNLLMRRSLSNVIEDISPLRVVKSLFDAVGDKGKLPWLNAERQLKIPDGQVRGFRWRKKGRVLIAIRRDILPGLVGLSQSSDTIIRLLGEAGVLEKGHGGKTTQQIPFTLVTSKGEEEKSLRMLVIDRKKLRMAANPPEA